MKIYTFQLPIFPLLVEARERKVHKNKGEPKYKQKYNSNAHAGFAGEQKERMWDNAMKYWGHFSGEKSQTITQSRFGLINWKMFRIVRSLISEIN